MTSVPCEVLGELCARKPQTRLKCFVCSVISYIQSGLWGSLWSHLDCDCSCQGMTGGIWYRREEGLGAGYIGSDPFGSSGSLGQLPFCEMELHIVAWGSKSSVLYLRELLVLGSPALSCIQAGIGAGINRR